MRMISYSLGDTLRLHMEVHASRFGLKPEDLFELAVRRNSKRSFLFVSRVLGKHLPIRPSALLAAGKLLALAYLGAVSYSHLDVYKRQEWKFAAVGSGFQGGLEALCRNFGLSV